MELIQLSTWVYCVSYGLQPVVVVQLLLPHTVMNPLLQGLYPDGHLHAHADDMGVPSKIQLIKVIFVTRL